MSNRSGRPNLSSLRRASETARTAIAEKCIKGMVRPSIERQAYAWGQYLEIRGRSVQRSLGEQYGIYGTSAAIQILAIQSPSGHLDLLHRSSPVLPLVIKGTRGQYSSLHEHFIKKLDLTVAYKLSSLLDAANSLEPLSRPTDFDVDKQKLVETLLSLRISGAGWPDYKSADEWQSPNTHATAVALLALSRGAVSVETKRACREALVWFYDQPLEKQSIATLSMMVMALVNLTKDAEPTSELRLPKIDQLRAESEGLVRNWIQGNSPDEVQRSLEGTEYWLPPGSATARTAGGAHFTFLLYLPHVLAGLAVLTSPRLRSHYDSRQFIIGIIDRITREINSQGCFIAAGRSMVSTVEHLWLYRLLYEFERQRLYRNWAIALLDYARYYITRRWLVSTCAILLTLGLGIAAALSGGKLQAALTAISAVVLTVVTATLATTFSNRWRDLNA